MSIFFIINIVLTWFPRASDDVHCKSELFACSFGGGPAKDFNAQVKTLFHSSMSKRDQLLTFDSPRAPPYILVLDVSSLNSMVVSYPLISVGFLYAR